MTMKTIQRKPSTQIREAGSAGCGPTRFGANSQKTRPKPPRSSNHCHAGVGWAWDGFRPPLFVADDNRCSLRMIRAPVGHARKTGDVRRVHLCSLTCPECAVEVAGSPAPARQYSNREVACGLPVLPAGQVLHHLIPLEMNHAGPAVELNELDDIDGRRHFDQPLPEAKQQVFDLPPLASASFCNSLLSVTKRCFP